MTAFTVSLMAYEASLGAAFGNDLDEAGLREKHDKMQESPFLFLRSTCWRWAECSAQLVPEVMDAPIVGSVGDAHAGNFGLWRDAEARLVWGINDYDEAARLPYTLDLVRLAASLILADTGDGAAIETQLLAGYAAGLRDPSPAVVEPGRLWLRDAFLSGDDDRVKFWSKLDALVTVATISPVYRDALAEAAPLGARLKTAIRRAGAGSLGRPRFAAHGDYRGGPIAYDAKGQMPSCWASGRERGLAGRLASSGTRSPDPTLVYAERVATRRLGPDNRKLDFDKIGSKLDGELGRAMAADLAAAHAGLGDASAVGAHLGRRPAGWLASAAARVAAWTIDDYHAYRKS